MNILFIAQRIPYPANKGEKIRSFNQIKFLADMGHNIHVISPIENETEVEYCEQLAQFKNIHCEFKKLPAKSLRLLVGFFKNEAMSVANFYSNALQSTIDFALKAHHFDAVICTSSAVAKYVFASKTLNQLPKKPMLLMDFMDLDSDKWRQYADKASFLMRRVYQREAKLISQYELKIQKSFDACFFIADAEIDLFKQTTGDVDNIHLLGNGMNTKEFYPAPHPTNNQSPKFIFTGVMDYKPNVDAVVWFVEHIWKEVIKQHPDAEFIIAGMNPNSTVQNLKKYPGITITGFVDDILPYYHQADYFVAPFRLARGVQNKVLQAFACGLPVISTPMGAEGITCEVNKDILIANNTDEFLTAINSLESNSTLKASITENALKLIYDHYSWSGKLQKLDKELKKAL